MVDCGCLIKLTFIFVTDSYSLLTVNNPLCLQGRLSSWELGVPCQTFLLIFPTTWWVKMAKGHSPGTRLFAERQLRWLILRPCCKFASQLGLHLKSPRIGFNFGVGVGETLGHHAVSWGKSKNIAFPFFKQSVLENGLWWITHQSNWSSFVVITRDLTEYSAFNFSSVPTR